ncbi:MAG: UDP-N-acetylmuramate dehydrogenase [Pseudomonadota bacterium]
MAFRDTQNFRINNSLQVQSSATAGGVVDSLQSLQQAWRRAQELELPLIALGAGTNVVPHAEVMGLVAEIQIPGYQVLEATEEAALIRVGAGEDWHQTVLRSVQDGYWGLENLALIPGTVGAAPVQNIGAYGVELADHLAWVEVMGADGTVQRIDRAACGFSYRDSRFKTDSGQIITAVVFKLARSATLQLDYPGIREMLDRRGCSVPTAYDVLHAVIAVRQSKLPNPRLNPNVGSFFKNPIVDQTAAQQLTQTWPGLSGFRVEEGVKLSAAQLIDLAGWKERSAASVACWEKQPLVLVNTSTAATSDVLAFADAIKRDVLEKFGVLLEMEPQILS